MYIALGISAGLALLFLVFLLIPVRIKLTFSHFAGKSEWAVYAGLGFLQINVTKLLQKNPSVPEVREKKTDEKKKLSFQEVENAFLKGVESVRYLKKKFTIRLFSFRARMGLGDAADTGIVTGGAYTALYGILGISDRYFILKKHEVVITPVFQGVGLEMEFRGEFQLRIIYCLGLINKIIRKGDVK